MSLRPLLTLLAASLAAPVPALAQGVINASHARFDATGTGFGVVVGPDVLPAWRGGGGFTLHVADKPFALYGETADGDRVLDELVQQSTLVVDLHGGFGFGGIADLAVVLPVAPVVVWGTGAGAFPVQDVDAPAVGDLVLLPKVQILNPAKTEVVGFGVQVPVTLPTGQPQRYLSDGGVNVAVDLLAELRVWRLRVLLNLSPIHVQPRFELGDIVRQFGMDWGGGVSFQLLESLAIRAEAWGSVSYVGTASKATGEWAVSVSLTPGELVQLELGVGSGMGGFTTPGVRAFAGVRVTAPGKEEPAPPPLEAAPAAEVPAESAPAEEAPRAEEAPAEEAPPAESAPPESAPAEAPPAESAPAEESPPAEPAPEAPAPQ